MLNICIPLSLKLQGPRLQFIRAFIVKYWVIYLGEKGLLQMLNPYYN